MNLFKYWSKPDVCYKTESIFGSLKKLPARQLSYFLSEPLCFSLILFRACLQWSYPLTISSETALQVVRTSFRFHLRECMGSSYPLWRQLYKDTEKGDQSSKGLELWPQKTSHTCCAQNLNNWTNNWTIFLVFVIFSFFSMHISNPNWNKVTNLIN